MVACGHSSCVGVRRLRLSWRYDRERRKTRRGGEAHIVVKTEPARLGTLTHTVEGLGRCEALPDHIATLTPAVEGHVHELLVAQGDVVKERAADRRARYGGRASRSQEKTATRDGLQASLVLLKSIPRLRRGDPPS